MLIKLTNLQNHMMKTKVISRRQFIKMTSGAVAAFGLSNLVFSKEFLALGRESSKPVVVWMEGQDCTGCTESVLASLNPMPVDVLLDNINLQYHETIMSGTGEIAETALHAAIEQGGYILVLEGSIPAADKRYLKVAGNPVEDTFIEAAGNASAIIAIGACATWGGIPRAGTTDGQGAEYFLDKHSIDKPLINIPGCPLHPAWFFDTVISFLNGEDIPLDSYNRPLKHFSRKVHAMCPNKGSNNCLQGIGCKGKSTYSDCPSLKWNDGVNWCIGSNAPCAGCTEPDFYNKFAPLYS
jgi:hydrogenase small subunit